LGHCDPRVQKRPQCSTGGQCYVSCDGARVLGRHFPGERVVGRASGTVVTDGVVSGRLVGVGPSCGPSLVGVSPSLVGVALLVGPCWWTLLVGPCWWT